MSEIKASDLGPMSSWQSKEVILTLLPANASVAKLRSDGASCASCLHARMNCSVNDFCIDVTRSRGEGVLRASLRRNCIADVDVDPGIYCSVREVLFHDWTPCKFYVSSVMRYSGD